MGWALSPRGPSLQLCLSEGRGSSLSLKPTPQEAGGVQSTAKSLCDS